MLDTRTQNQQGGILLIFSQSLLLLLLRSLTRRYAIWIGPAQQADSGDPCAAHPCSLCWPELPNSRCDAPTNGFYINITLRNITVNSPKGNPGVLLANSSALMQNVVFDNVVVNNPSATPAKWGTNYLCEGVASGVATGTTSPVPPCFKDQTEDHRKTL